METPLIFIVISIIALLLLIYLIHFSSKNKNPKPLSLIASIAFGFVLAGIIFDENRYLRYGLIGLGIILSIIDIMIKSNNKKKINQH